MSHATWAVEDLIARGYGDQIREQHPDLFGDVPSVTNLGYSPRAAAGVAAQAAGHSFESIVTPMNQSIIDSGRGFVSFCGHRTKVLKGGEKIVHVGLGPPDVMGVVDYIAVVFDVKSVSKAKSFGFKRAGLKSKGNWHQYEAIVAAGRSGAFAGVFVRWGIMSEYRWHNWDIFDGNGRTRLSDGLPVDSWVEAFDIFRNKIRRG